jgi:hypothetical protein
VLSGWVALRLSEKIQEEQEADEEEKEDAKKTEINARCPSPHLAHRQCTRCFSLGRPLYSSGSVSVGFVVLTLRGLQARFDDACWATKAINLNERATDGHAPWAARSLAWLSKSDWLAGVI